MVKCVFSLHLCEISMRSTRVRHFYFRNLWTFICFFFAAFGPFWMKAPRCTYQFIFLISLANSPKSLNEVVAFLRNIHSLCTPHKLRLRCTIFLLLCEYFFPSNCRHLWDTFWTIFVVWVLLFVRKGSCDI